MNLVNLESLDVDLVIVFIIFLFVFNGVTGAGIFAFGQGLITDILSGGILGLYTLIYLIVFLTINIFSRPLDLFSPGGQIAITSMAVLLKEALLITLLHLFSMEMNISFANLLSFVSSILCSGLIAPILFYLINYFVDIFMGEENKI